LRRKQPRFPHALRTIDRGDALIVLLCGGHDDTSSRFKGIREAIALAARLQRGAASRGSPSLRWINTIAIAHAVDSASVGRQN